MLRAECYSCQNRGWYATDDDDGPGWELCEDCPIAARALAAVRHMVATSAPGYARRRLNTLAKQPGAEKSDAAMLYHLCLDTALDELEEVRHAA